MNAFAFPTGFGKLDTRKGTGQDYRTITGADIVQMVETPQQGVEKDNAQWFIPSAYHAQDARDHATQRALGTFHWLTLDVDQNDLELEAVTEALDAVLGPCRRLIYSTASATPDNRKWRALVPLAEPLSGTDFSDTQAAFFDMLEDVSQGTLIPDRALQRTGQPIYLPNSRTGFYQRQIVKAPPCVNLGADHPIISRRASDRAARAVAEGEAETRSQAKVAERAARQLAGDDVSPIDAFNDRHDVAELLARYGYAQLRGSSDWRSPYQTSGSFATRCFGDHWVSLSASDSAADIGAPSKSGARFGDAFDLFCHFEHGGTTAIAVAAYGAEMRQSDPPHVGSDAGWTPQDETGEAETPPPHPDEFYAGSADGAGTVASGGSGKSSRKVAFFPASDLDGQTVPVRQWLVLDLIPSGTVTMLGGDGGTGKSLLALQLAASVAHGGFPWLGHHPERGTAVFLSAEDDRDELHRRVADVARAEGVSLAEMRDLHLLSLAGEDALLATLGPDGSINRTALANAVESYLVKHPSQLMVLDTLADLYPGNENDRAQARQFIGLCRGIAIRQNCAILLLSHPSLSGLNSGAGTSGSTAWNNSVRSRLYLERVIQDGYEPNPDARVMTAKKANYGRTGGEINMTWQDGVFVAEQVATGLDRVAASMKSERVFLKLLRLFTEQGRRVNAGGGQTYAPSVFSAHPDSEGINKRAFRSAMEGLLHGGKIVVGQDGPPSKRRQFLAFPGEAEASAGDIPPASAPLDRAAE